MATTEDQKDIPETEQNPDNAENPEEEKEEEEPVDLELQKEMKGLKIKESDFQNEPKTKKSGKKSKNPEDKKIKKKGQDFIDYANKNNIQINIEYEENKYQLKKKDEQKTGEKGSNRFNDNKRQNNRGGYKNDKNHPQKRQQHIHTGNKFDVFNQRPPFQQYYNHRPTPKLVENKEILEYLEKFFGEENLNKNTYIRNRLKDGKILVDDIVAYNDIKKNNINAEKILEIIKDSQNLECVNEQNKNYIKIKNFDKLNLLTIEEIVENNKKRIQKMPYMNQYGAQPYPYNAYNFVNLQNNVFIYNKFPMYNYPQSGYVPGPENK